MMQRLGIVIAVFSAMLTSGTALAAQGNPAAGEEKAQSCASCHGPEGRETQANQYPKLAGQHRSYLYHTLKQYKSGERENAVMSGMVSNLSEQDMRDLAAYYATREPAVHTMPLESATD